VSLSMQAKADFNLCSIKEVDGKMSLSTYHSRSRHKINVCNMSLGVILLFGLILMTFCAACSL